MTTIFGWDPGDAPQTYPLGRRCDTRGCRTILSRYNPDRFCNPCLHERAGRELRRDQEVWEASQPFRERQRRRIGPTVPERVLALIRASAPEPMSCAALVALLGVGSSSVRYALRDLVVDGTLEVERRDREGFYCERADYRELMEAA